MTSVRHYSPALPPRPAALTVSAALTVLAAVTVSVVLTISACSGGGLGGSAQGGGRASNAPESSAGAGLLPADRVPAPPAPSAPCARAARAAGWVAAENAKPGDDGWQDSAKPDRLVNAYLSAVSALCGDTVDLHMSGYVPTATVTAYRLGWYDGKGGRAVWKARDVPVSGLPVAKPTPPTFTVEADWPTALQIHITPDWTPGYYLVVARAEGSGSGNAVPFFVRDGSGAAGSGTAPVLFQASVLTYQAYNTFGGYSLYNGPSDLSEKRADRSRVASFDRPYGGSGYLAPFAYDVPLVERMERLGLDVDYTTDVDVDRQPSQVAAHKVLVVGGHSEYWTRRMYDAAQFARDHGVNIAFFGANTVYWHARLESSPAGADRRMAVYRVAAEDPLARADPAAATVEWREPPLNRPEAGLVGADFGEFGTSGGGFRVLAAASWVFAGTGVTDGQVLAGSLGGEFDTVRPELPVTPPNIDVIAAAPIMFVGRPAMATFSYYSAPSGAGVFSGGTTYWPCQVSGSCDGRPADPRTSRILGTMTDNVLRSFAAGPAGRAHPSRRRLAPSAEALVGTAADPHDVAVRPR